MKNSRKKICLIRIDLVEKKNLFVLLLVSKIFFLLLIPKQRNFFPCSTDAGDRIISYLLVPWPGFELASCTTDPWPFDPKYFFIK